MSEKTITIPIELADEILDQLNRAQDDVYVQKTQTVIDSLAAHIKMSDTTPKGTYIDIDNLENKKLN